MTSPDWFVKMSEDERREYFRQLSMDRWDLSCPLPTVNTYSYEVVDIGVRCYVNMDAERELIESIETELSRYPHVCPRCGSPAYVGLNDVDCVRGCR